MVAVFPGLQITGTHNKIQFLLVGKLFYNHFPFSTVAGKKTHSCQKLYTATHPRRQIVGCFVSETDQFSVSLSQVGRGEGFGASSRASHFARHTSRTSVVRSFRVRLQAQIVFLKELVHYLMARKSQDTFANAWARQALLAVGPNVSAASSRMQS